MQALLRVNDIQKSSTQVGSSHGQTNNIFVCQAHRDCAIHMERISMYGHSIAFTRIIDMGLTSAGNEKLEGFKWTANDILYVLCKSSKHIM